MSPVNVKPESLNAWSSLASIAASVLVSGKLCTARRRLTFWLTEGSTFATTITSWVAGTIFSTVLFGLTSSSTAAALTEPRARTAPAGISRRRWRSNQDCGAAAAAGAAGGTGCPESGCGAGVRSPSILIWGMPHSINSPVAGNLLAARGRCQGVAEMQRGEGLHLVRREPRAAAGLVLPLDLLVDGRHPGVVFAHLGCALQPQCRVDPVGDAGQPGPVVDGDAERPVENTRRVEDVVNLLVLEQAVGVNAGAGHVEAGAGEGVVRGQRRPQPVAEIGRRASDRGGVDAGRLAAQTGVIDDQRFEWRVTGPLAETEERTIGGGAAIEPSGDGVDFAAMEIIVPVPLEMLGRDSEALGEEAHQPRHAAGQSGFWPWKAETHRVAEPELDGDARLSAKLLQRGHQWRDEAVQIGARQILEVDARTDAGVDHGADDPRIVGGCLTARSVHLEVDVVVGGGNQDAGFLDAGRLHRPQILQRRAHPGRHLRARPWLAGGDCLAIDRRVGEELGLPDHRPAQLVQQVVQMDNLLDAVGRPRLRAIAKGGVRDPDIGGRGQRHGFRLEADRRDAAVGKVLAQQIRLGAIQHDPLYAYVDLYCNLLTATIGSRRLERA